MHHLCSAATKCVIFETKHLHPGKAFSMVLKLTRKRRCKSAQLGGTAMDAFGCTFRPALSFAQLSFELQMLHHLQTRAAAGPLLQDS
jgi:hypothetical protein